MCTSYWFYLYTRVKATNCQDYFIQSCQMQLRYKILRPRLKLSVISAVRKKKYREKDTFERDIFTISLLKEGKRDITISHWYAINTYISANTDSNLIRS